MVEAALQPGAGRLAANIAHFTRALRRAGLRVGPDRLVSAVRAVEVAGFTSREDFYWTLHAAFVSRPEDRAVFQQIFRLFWRDPRYLEKMLEMLLPSIRGGAEEQQAAPAARRAAEALLNAQANPDNAGDRTEIEIDATGTLSGEERLRTLDFEQMSPEETAAARQMVARLRLPVAPLMSRRWQVGAGGSRVDWRRTMLAAIRTGGEVRAMARTTRRARWPDLVVMCDISGSMAGYSRMMLHFLHAVMNTQGRGWSRVHAFTFGTHLTNITRHLSQRDVDQALAAAGAEAQDWQGGTRIGESLHAFNRDWSRRVMGQGALVLIVTDGLDRGDPGSLGNEMERLHLTARRLIWLNPLLRWDGFAPRAAGVAAMLPHVDGILAGHSIASLEELGRVLSRPGDRGAHARLMAMLRRNNVVPSGVIA